MKMQRRGRPPKDVNRSQVLPPIRVTEDQIERYKKAAEESGKKLSSWLKEVADNEANKVLGNNI
ncbi:MAG: hypothetical protein R3E73_01505 [Porticoccaceae bacterium]